MVLIRAYGHNAAVDLFEHHLVITRPHTGLMSEGPGSEQFIPLSSIRSVQFYRPGWASRGKMVLMVAGSPVRNSGTEADENTVFFVASQTAGFERIVHAIRDAIATPTLEQLAMAAQRNRAQDRVSQARPTQRSEPEPTRNRFERIDDPSSSHGGGYGNAGFSGPYDYYGQAPRQDAPRRDPIASLPTGGWWQDMPLAGKIILIAVVLITMITTCSYNGGTTSEAGEQASSSASETSAAATPSDSPTGRMLADWSEFVTGEPSASQLAITDGAGKIGEFCSASTGARILIFGDLAPKEGMAKVHDAFSKNDVSENTQVTGAFSFDRAGGKLHARNLQRQKLGGDGELQPTRNFTMDVAQVSPGEVSVDGVNFHTCIL